MPAPTTCPQCRAVRAPNARFCQQCGHDYESAIRQSPWSAAEQAAYQDRRKVDLDVSVTNGFKLGLGLALGTFLAGIPLTIISFTLFGALLGSISSLFR